MAASTNDNWGRTLFVSGEKRGESSALAFVSIGYLRALIAGLEAALQQFESVGEFKQESAIVLGPQIELWVYNREDEIDQAIMDAEAKILKERGLSKFSRWRYMRPRLPDARLVQWLGLKGVHHANQD